MTDEMLRATVSVRGVLLAPGEETLVVRRASDGVWELPGGRLGPDEDVEAGLRRELREETTLEPDVEDTVHANSWRNDADAGRFAVYYRCRTADRDVALSEEHDAFRWVPDAEAASRLPDQQAIAVRRAIPDDDVATSAPLPPPATSD